MPENRFVDDVARTYDRTNARMAAPEVLDPAVDCLESLAEGGRVLEFSLVYLVFNTITNLTTQDDDFIDRTHLQISRSRHFHRTADGTFREFTRRSGTCGRRSST